MKVKIGSRPTRFDFKTTVLAAAPPGGIADLAEASDPIDFPPMPSGAAHFLDSSAEHQPSIESREPFMVMLEKESKRRLGAFAPARKTVQADR